jgi:hypothetical protein
MKVEFSLQSFENAMKIDENVPDASRVVPCGRTDGQMDKHDEANSLFSQICEHAIRLRQLNPFESYLILTENKMDHSNILHHIVCLEIINPRANKNKHNL